MRQVFACYLLATALVIPWVSAAPDAPTDTQPKRGLTEVGSENVDVVGGFWGPRLKAQHDVTIPHALDELERDGHVTNFDKAAGKATGPLRGHHAFDSDLYKALEGAALSLKHNDDARLRQRVDGIVDRIVAAQQKDGYLISYFIVKEPDKKWQDLRLTHQMYNAGHFFEMAIAFEQLGDHRALDAARRFADNIDNTFGPGKRYDVDGHEEVELALVRLFRATGERRYLNLARFFLDERGYQHGSEHKPFDWKAQPVPVRPEGKLTEDQRREFFHDRLRYRNGRMQDHKPLVDQHEAIGHAVRAGYLYSAMADMLRFMDAPGYEPALDDIWTDVISRKIYLTGGVGTGQYDDEGFGDPYLLPNDSAYCESCAAISHVLWQHRMCLLKQQAKYADVLELTVYNGMLSGISIPGDRFFYENPLASGGGNRSSWIGLSCCPTNLTRIIPEVGGLAYAQGKQEVFVNLYLASETSLKMADGATVKLSQQTNYPWDGQIKLTVTPDRADDFTLSLRIPGWAMGRPLASDLYRFEDANVPPVGLKLNGDVVDATAGPDGYVHLHRTWKAGDVVELSLPMPIHRVYAHEKVAADQGKVALMRGPLVYCVESVDHPGVEFSKLSLQVDAELKSESRPDLLGGVTVLLGQAAIDGHASPLTAIPYYAWANRQRGPMTIWIDQAGKK